MTKEKRPNVKIVNGSVKIRISGLIKVFTIPKITATITAVRKLFTCTPAKTWEAIKIANPLINKYPINAITQR